jgi:hypothetical protein
MTESIPIKPITAKSIFIPGGNPDDLDSDVERFVEERRQAAPASIIDTPPAKPKPASRKRQAPTSKPPAQRLAPASAKAQPITEDSDNEPPSISIPAANIKQSTGYDSFNDSSDDEYQLPKRKPQSVNYDSDRSIASTPRIQKPAQQATPSKPAASPDIDGEIVDRHTMIQRIVLYRQSFPAKIGKQLMTKLKKVEIGCRISDAELKTILDECRMAVSSSATNSLMLPLFISGMMVYESVAIRVGLKINGITAMLAQDPGINAILTEISIEYLRINYVKPEWRLLWTVMQTSYTLHRTNAIMLEQSKLSNVAPPPVQKPPQPDKPLDKDAVTIVEAPITRTNNVPCIDGLDNNRFHSNKSKYETL